MTMIEKVAMAIERSSEYGLSDEEAATYALAAIEAMREPTEEMLFRGADQICSFDFNDDSAFNFARATFRAMIDAALEEQKSPAA